MTTFAWAYGPTLQSLKALWLREPDYSHGFLVIPLAILFLWLRRSDLRTIRVSPSRWGLALIFLSLVLRWVGLRYSFDSLDGYSLIVWISGAVMLLGGPRLTLWALPSILFLLFMVPIPFQLERLMSVPLQRVATALSCFVLQCLGQPAFSEGTTILLGNHQLHVEQACSGLRIFVGTFALAFAYVIAARRELWEQAILLCCVVPTALLANAARIVITALLYRYSYDEEAIRQFNHDAAGWVMILIAAVLFGIAQLYLTRLLVKVDVMRIQDLVGRGRAEA